MIPHNFNTTGSLREFFLIHYILLKIFSVGFAFTFQLSTTNINACNLTIKWYLNVFEAILKLLFSCFRILCSYFNFNTITTFSWLASTRFVFRTNTFSNPISFFWNSFFNFIVRLFTINSTKENCTNTIICFLFKYSIRET